MTDEVMARLEHVQYLIDNAAGEAFLPDGWQRLVAYLPALLSIAEVAHELVGVTTHANVTGPEYADRKLMYAKLRDFLGRLP